MAVEKCPCCNRGFYSLGDYPRIYIASFNHYALPKESKFPLECLGGVFVDPGTGLLNKKVPDQVIKLFEEQSQDEVDFHGWQWSRLRMSRGYTYGVSNDDESDLIKKIFSFRLAKYFKKMEDLVGKEVPSSQIQPPRLLGSYSCDYLDNPGVNISTRGVRLNITRYSGGSIGVLEPITTIATLDYEGRLNSH